ncbi:hypothetical protein C8T65DRAFT_739260 [Cerioporus squamosus]|nr:hypothetical protein C8T65DRAFT_739260 [Cerioporus squamosus]
MGIRQARPESEPTPAAPTPTKIKLGDFSIDEYRPIKVIVIGAGFSGILSAIRFPQKIPNVDLTIYEKNSGVGGTWHSNRYPGIACDIPAHCYQFSFEDKAYPLISLDRDWSAFYAPGHEIRQHLQDVVDKLPASGTSASAWPKGDSETEFEEFEDVADVFVTAFGVLSRWNWPDIAGMKDFKGELYHTAQFDPEGGSWDQVAESWKDKRVGVIGSGSSAIQTVAAVHPKVAKLVNYVRGQTWIAVPFAGDTFSELLERKTIPQDGEFVFSPEELDRFKTDPEYFRRFRRTMESLVNTDFVTSPIKRFTESGIETEDGQRQELDIILCATGYDVSWQLPFDIIGRNGVVLNEKWKPYPSSYLSMCVDEFPNMFMVLGPNSVIGAGTLLPIIEFSVNYAVQATAKMQRERLKSMEVKVDAVRDFDQYIESYFPLTVFSDKCRSWYKLGKDEGRIVGLWPGSNLHALKALQLYWLGDGQTSNEKTPTGDRAWYLSEDATEAEGDGHPAAEADLGGFSIDEYIPMKVVVIGAGFSGILAGIRFPQKIPGVNLTIYEKSAGVGGTWYNHNYPGVACDIPALCYQYSFEDKRDWSSFHAPGPEIQQHLQDVVDKYKVWRYLKLQHEVVHAAYDQPTGRWHLRIRRLKADGEGFEEIQDVADVLVNAIGVLARWKLPAIAGIHGFTGELYHTAQFAPMKEPWEVVAKRWRQKRVGVIGVGSAAIQVVAALQPRVGQLVNFVRGQAWFTPPLGSDLVSQILGQEDRTVEGNVVFTSEEKERFVNEPGYASNVRCLLENRVNSMHSLTQKGSARQTELQEILRRIMDEKLAKKPWIAEQLTPGYPVGCRRLMPGPDYLAALCADNTDFVSSPIRTFTASGVETEDGVHHELDVVFCATGYDTSWQLPFAIIGRNGMSLNEKWKSHPTSYLSMCVDDFPNMFMCLGPNCFVGTGSLIPMIESTVMYAVQATAKMQRERLKSMEVKANAVEDFQKYIESYFPKTVYSDQCRSWYKMGKENGRIIALWPGSNLHAKRTLEHPRWEDFRYEQRDTGVTNRFYWLGDGQTYAEKTLTGDRAWYLAEDQIDRPPVASD